MDEHCQSYEDWKHCITVRCGITLAADYVSQRIRALSDKKDPMTARFVVLYGDVYREQVLGWFRQAQAELGVGKTL